MDAGLIFAAALLGLASGAHCLGMCGGIVGAFSTIKVDELKRPVPRLTTWTTSREWRRQLAFNFGRITSYALAGALAGALGLYASRAVPLQGALYVVANVALILVGLHLAGLSNWITKFESLGLPLWRRLQPLAARLSPRERPYRAGLVWGWLPCGLVYAALAMAALAGGPAQGAASMLAFGLGTLPWLLLAGLAAARLRAWMGRRALRVAAGGTVLAFGAFGLAHAF